MTIVELFAYGNDLMQQGNTDMAAQIWQDVIRKDPMFGPAHANLADVFRKRGNLVAERDELIKFLQCPVNGITLDLVGPVKSRIDEITKQLNPPQPAPAK